ncbi:MAG: Tetratricopeptide 2 [Bacteroidetes bacterium]|nr:Tetratricopeptide 2 [Bacteroidota bacterium]
MKTLRNFTLTILLNCFLTDPAMRNTMLRIGLGIVVFTVSVFAIIGCNSRRDRSAETRPVTASYVGYKACLDCHKREFGLWTTSDHSKAMAVASDSTVLGDFNDATFTQHGITSRFTKSRDGYFVRTEGEDGKLHDYRISYVFGYRPLQQYLVEFPGGTYQTLPLCWDTRPKKDGGQRWYHIYGDERIAPNDILFWTRVAQNWNYMCAECHSTNLLKNYDHKQGKYATSWTDIAVACEACHGPGSEHVAWANTISKGAKPEPGDVMGLTVRLKDPDRGTWTMNMKTGNSTRTTPLKSDVLLETCARCHARRAQLHEPYVPGQPLMSTHLPALLEEQLYFADGQIKDEVYEYASYKQSTMYQRGVICTDCHEPHSMKLYARDNTLCYRCHLAEKFGARAHHFHNPDSTGASCIDCHMPTRTYMGIDVRRDHSYRIPRPALGGQFGVPNTCNACHPTKSVRWAGEFVTKWYGTKTTDSLHYAHAIFAGRTGTPNAPDLLVRLAGDPNAPVIARATALSMLRQFPGEASAEAVRKGLMEGEPLIRLGAVQGLGVLPATDQFYQAKHLLTDTLPAIRVEATGALLNVPPTSLPSEGHDLMEKAIRDYRAVQEFNADHPSAHLNLGNLALRDGDFATAETEYRKAIELEPASLLSYVNLADLYRLKGEEQKGEKALNDALKMNPDFADGHYALGLLMVREKRSAEGINHLKRAAELRPDEPRYVYAYGVGLNSTGNGARAVSVLEEALKKHPYNKSILVALVTILRDRGNREEALRHAETLVRYWPQDQSFARLYQGLAMSGRQ